MNEEEETLPATTGDKYRQMLLTEYMQPGITLSAIADKYKLPLDQLQHVAQEENWLGMKMERVEDKSREMELALQDRVAEYRVGTFEKLQHVSNKFMDRATEELDHITKTGDMERLAKVVKSMSEIQQSSLGLVAPNKSEMDVNISAEGFSLTGYSPIIDVSAVEHRK